MGSDPNGTYLCGSLSDVGWVRRVVCAVTHQVRKMGSDPIVRDPIARQGPAVSALLSQATTQLGGLDSARLDAEVLLSHTLDRPRSFLHAWPETPVSQRQAWQYRRLIERRAAGEPVAYLTGRREFWSMDLAVTRDTLIPRPETETLVELALERMPQSAAGLIADLGTGSGAIALAIARERPGCSIIAADCAPAALTVACGNARRLGIDRVHFVLADWCRPLQTHTLDMIVCNPPYVAEQDPHLYGVGVRFEPRAALASGPDGLRDICTIIRQAKRVLRARGWLLLEHGYQQGPAVRRLLKTGGYHDISSHTDGAGNPRVTVCRSPS